MNEKMYKASDVIGILLEEITNAEFLRVTKRLSDIPSSMVRCEDCKRWDGVPADETQDHECHLFDGNEENIRIATPSYWFCPMGEREEE